MISEWILVILLCEGVSAQNAVEDGLTRMAQRVHGDGGCIAVDRLGNVGIHFTTQGMAWAYCRSGHLHYGIYPQDHVDVPLNS
jgi:isoaspartyl peptidase/L-asparaginase-like protein (Ntn-hydrolase superfamily)